MYIVQNVQKYISENSYIFSIFFLKFPIAINYYVFSCPKNLFFI